VALIHYYKFNNNLYDSIGTFDLLADFGTPTYTTGKLGGSTGAVTSTIGSMYIFGCAGTGAAASGFLAADTTEAAAGVSAWSMTGWVYCSGTTTQIINLLSSTSGQSSAYLQYDQKFGGLTFRASQVSCSTGTWVFFTVRVTGGTCYLSVNGGSESSSAWNTGSGTGGKTQFNGIRIGSPSLYIALYARVDDVRVFNHSLSSGEIAGIYNAGLPAEATARNSNYLNVYRHFKYNSLSYDTSGNSPSGIYSINSVVFFGSLSYSSGIAANTNQSGTITTTSPGTPAQLTCGNSDFLKSTGRNDTDSFAYFLWMSNTTGLYGNLDLGSFILQPNANNLKVFTAGLGITNISIPNGYALHKGFIYDGIAKRFSYYENSQLVAHKDGALDYTNYYPYGFSANGASSGASVFNIDDVRFYRIQTSGIEALDIYNSGSGTEASTVSGTATGSGATVTMAAPTGAAIVPTNGAATGSGITVTMAAPTGAAIVPTNGTAIGAGRTVTVTAFSGIAFINGSASGLLDTVVVSPITGFSPLAFGSLKTIQVTSFSGQATGGALSSGALASVTVSSFAGIAFPEFIGTGSLSTVSVTAIEAVASISTSIQLSYCACDAEIGWKQSLPITGFVSAVQGEDAISARITPVVSGTDANIVFFEQRTLTASSSYTYDLRSLTDFLGQSFSLSRVYAISVVMTSGSATISPGASNPLKWFFNSNTANVTITSGNSFMFAQKGSAIVSNSAKTILVTNPSGLSACVYKIAILGGR